jgi:uncharacterized protein (AIM24 family)
MQQQPQAPYVCPYCGTGSDGSAASCPGCGSPVNVALKTSQSGWLELPAARDMARIQFGRSSVQIEGVMVPVADFALAPGDGVYFAHHELLWKEPAVNVTQRSMAGAWKRFLAGLPITLLDAHGPGRIAFSRDAPGETLAIPIRPGFPVDVREHLFMVATQSVAYDYFATNIWFETQNGDERETHYPLGAFMDRFHVPRDPGLLLIHAHGNAFIRQLHHGERILVKPSALLYKDSTVQMQLHFEHPRKTSFSLWTYGERYLWLALYGPGRVAIQSAYGHTHDPGHSIVRDSGATRHSW